MANQSGQNVLVSYGVQSALGTPKAGAGGYQLRILPGVTGFQKQHALIENATVRSDGQSALGRHGMATVPGSHKAYLALSEWDQLFAGGLRNTWTASVAITQAAMTSITTTTNTIVAAGGDWVAQGVHVGDQVQLANHSTAANNGKWFRVLGVTASTITLPAASLTADAVADSAFSLTVAKTLIQGTSPTETYFSWDELQKDIGTSWVTTDAKVTSLDVAMSANANIEVTVNSLGLNQTVATGGAAPSLTSPTEYTTKPLVLSDGLIRVNGVDYATVTGLSFKLDIPASVPAVIAKNGPDVFMGNAKVTGSLSFIRTGSDLWTTFDNETAFDIFVTAKENEAEPTDFVQFYMGNVILDNPSAPLGSEGALIETYPFRCGIDDGGTSGHQSTTLKISTSAA